MDEHEQYLENCINESLIQSYVYDCSLELYHQLLECGMPVPAACTGPEGQMLYHWDKDHHHLEFEIMPDGTINVFYKNRNYRTCWQETYCSYLILTYWNDSIRKLTEMFVRLYNE